MKKKNASTKRFPFRFSKLIITLSILALCLCLIGGGIATSRWIEYGAHSLQEFLQSPFLILVCVFGIVVLVSLLIRSEYAVSEKHFHSNFGIIKSKVELEKITALVCDYKEKKVTVYMGEEFFVALVREGDIEPLVRAVQERNEKVDVSFTLTENKPMDK